MNDIELYIDGQRVILSNKQVVAPTYQAFDVGNITKIKFDYTNTFTLPFCDVNNNVFENSFKVQSQSAKRFNANTCKLIKGGREILPNGIAEYIGSNDTGYQIVCYSAPLEFFNLISELNIRDLDYTGYNHLNNPATIVASQSRTDKWIYPLIDWHSDSPNNFIRSDTRSIDTRFMMPTLFYHEILNKIFIEAGYVLNNNTELHPMFQQYDLVFTTDNKNNYLLYSNNLTIVDVPNSNGYFNLVGGDVVESWALVFESLTTAGEERFINTKQANYNITSTDNTWSNDMTLTGITPIETDTYRLRYIVDLGFGLNPNPAASIIVFAILIDDGFGNLTEIYRETKTPTSANPQTLSWDFFINLTAGENYFMQLTQITPALNNPFLLFRSQRLIIDKVNVGILPYVPDIKQTDLIKNYLQITGSILTFDKYRNIFIIERFDKVIENKGIAKNWSNKIYDNNKKPSLKHKIGSYGVSNAFRYTNDENDFKRDLADGFINSSNQNLNKLYEVVELLFASSTTVVILKNLQIARINAFEAKTGQTTIAGQDFIVPLDSKIRGEIIPRILLVRRETLATNDPIIFTDGSTTVNENEVAIAHFIDPLQAYSLGFGSNVLDTFYQWLQSVLNDPIVLEQDMKFNAQDVTGSELDFLIPVYFNQHNAYFYINKINSFLENKKVKTEFIKI